MEQSTQLCGNSQHYTYMFKNDKNRLDKFWENQYIIYDFNAQLLKTKNRSRTWCV